MGLSNKGRTREQHFSSGKKLGLRPRRKIGSIFPGNSYSAQNIKKSFSETKKSQFWQLEKKSLSDIDQIQNWQVEIAKSTILKGTV